MAERFLEGLKKAKDGRYILRESISVDSKNIRVVPLSDKEIKEIKEKKQDFNGKQKYIIKIWDRNFNANERSYAKVMDRVVKENRRTVGLMNHPEDEPDPEKIFAVEKNPFIDDDGWLAVEFCPCGFWGDMVEDVLLNDGPVTVSSACLGDLDSEGYVINDDSFEVERYFDFVFNPSNRLNQFTSGVERVEDNGEITPLSDKGTITEVKTHRDNASEKIKSEKTGDKIMPDKDTLLETTMKMNIRSMLREAEKMENLSEKKEILSSAHSYASQIADNKLTEEIGNEIKKVDEQIQTLAEKGKKSDELTQSVATLTEEKTNLEKEVASLKEEKAKVEAQLKTITTMYETKQYKTGENDLQKMRRMSKEICTLKMKNKMYEKTIENLKRNKKIMERKALVSEARANTKADASMVEELQTKNSILENKNKELMSRLHETRISSFRSSERKPDRSRFLTVRKQIEEQRKQKPEPQKTITESKEILDEDDKMEKMLNHDFN